MGAGIDYGMGTTNVDKKTGIRYGVICANDVGQAWYDESETNYDPHCPDCGNDTEEHDEGDEHIEHWCPHCKKDCGDDVYGDEPSSITYEKDGYIASQDSYNDIFIIKSPYFTKAQFCSPCAPGAGHLGNPDENGVRTYCFGHDWFDDGKAPYPVYNVSDGAIVEPETK